MNSITVTVARGTAEQRSTSEYRVPRAPGLSVMDVLDYIYENLDPTLSYFSHEACRQTACGKCLVRVNGKICLACGCPADTDTLVLEPWNDRVVRDLVCEMPSHGK